MSSLMTNSITNIQQTSKSRFPRLQECAHFHYEVNTIDLPKNFKCILLNTTTDSNDLIESTNSTKQDQSGWFQLQVTSNDKKWVIYRTYENFRYLDKHLHDCIFDRKFSCLDELKPIQNDLMTSSTMSTLSKKNLKHSEAQLKHLRIILNNYLNRFSEIAFVNPLNCGPILNWFEIDNKGNRLFAIDDSPINIPGVAAAVVVKRYVAQNLDEISLDVGNMISVIDMPPPDESCWWRGKKELEVGFFPADCVELIKCNQHLSSNVTEHLPKMNQNQSVRLKHGKLITILRTFFTTRPARNQLQSKGILRQRVFACDLGEHLSNTQQDVPKILTICTEFIEKNGIVDGIYRHTGLQSNIQKLRNAFDEEKFSEIEQEIYINDVHSVSSLLKMYFRELPNPLLTYQLYQKFIKAVNVEDKIFEIHDVVQQLPPPHYRTLAFLMKHLHKLAEYSSDTNMNTKNLAIVWAPNLLKSKEMDSSICMQYDMLHSITLQANISEFLIANADTIFNDKFASLVRKQDGSMKTNQSTKTYRPISVCYNNTSNKLLTLEEAQDKYKQVGPAEMPKYHTEIDIPGLKKKNKKDKKNTNNEKIDKNMNQNLDLPANIKIQQQFDILQQQQQNDPKNMPNSNSTQTISISSPISVNNNSNSQPPIGSSSPSFKSLFGLRVGSIKQSSNNNSNNNNNISSNSSSKNNQLSSPSTITISAAMNSTGPIIETNELVSKPIITSNSLSRTASTSTFKPPASSTLGINPNQDCIAQLQSTASQAINSSTSSHYLHHHNHHLNHPQIVNLTSFTGTLSSPSSTSIMRNNRFNQSQTSIHSNIINQQQLNSPSLIIDSNQPIQFSTFKDINSPANNESINSPNPIPSKRRTIQPIITQQQTNQIPLSNSTTHLSTFNRSISIKKKSNSPQHEYDDLDQLNQLNKEIHQNQTDDDEMEQLVAYINKFEKEKIVTNNPIEPEQNQIVETNSNEHDQLDQEDKQSNNLIQSIIEQEDTSKLRLSSSSLSSSADSGLNTDLKQIDRRTYIINKIYDNLDDDDDDDDDNDVVIVDRKNEQLKQDINIIDDDQYEKVILNNSNKQNQEESEYDNDLLVNNKENDQENDNVLIVNRANLANIQSQLVKEHIYVNMNQFSTNESNLIRESTGFDVSNVCQIDEDKEITFDNQLVELNNQIKLLLNNDEQNIKSPKVRPKSAGLINNNNSDNLKRRITVSCAENSNSITKSNSIDEILKNNTNNMNCKLSKNRSSFRLKENINENESKFKILPKTRQSVSVSSPFEHQSNQNEETITKTLSKSLQDNSNLIKQDTTSSSVKSKIKLMESIVSSVNNNKSMSNKSERSSSSSSSSCSSSRSPPMSPKTILNHNKPQAPQVPARTNVNINNAVKLNVNSLDSDDLRIEEETRKTVKELKSKFEPK